MKTALLIFFTVLFSTQLFAYKYTIKGKVTGDEDAKISIYSAINPFMQIVEVEKDGKFEIKGEFPVPSQFMIELKSGKNSSGYELYLFKDAVVDVSIDVSGQYPDWQLKGVPALSEEGYEKIPAFRRSYIAQIKSTSNMDSLFEAFEKELYSMLGKDDLAMVTAKSAKFSLMKVIVTPEMKSHYDIFSLADFEKLPINEIQYSGIPYYNDIMEDYNLRLIYDSLKVANNDSLYFASYKEMLELVEQRKNVLPEPIFLEMKYRSFHRYREGQGTKTDEKEYLKSIEDFIAAHPNYRSQEYLQQKYDQIKNSLIGKVAPVFTLTDTTEAEHKFPNTQGKYVLVDVWGSWCAPCRFYNKKLVEMYPRLKETGKIEFVSIAYDPNKDAWKQAILDDGLQWPQLYSTPEFIAEYHITAYPTMFLLSPEGVVIKKGHLSEEALMEYLR